MSDADSLDTCAAIWMATGARMSEPAHAAFEAVAEGEGRLHVRHVRLGHRHAGCPGQIADDEGRSLPWFEDFVGTGGITIEAASPEILIAASFLPSPFHKDPVDRIIIATARERNLTIMTRDQAILRYGAAGHGIVLAC